MTQQILKILGSGLGSSGDRVSCMSDTVKIPLRRGGGVHPPALASLGKMALGASVGFLGIGQSN